MKKTLYAVLLAVVLSCKGENEAAIDPEILKPLLNGYFEYFPKPIAHFSSRIACREGYMVISKAFITQKDEKTLSIQFVYVGKCAGLNPNPGNDYEIRATFTSPMPKKEDTRYRIDFTGVCDSAIPADPQLVGKKIEGHAYLTKDLGEFVINLPVSVNNIPQTITSRMDIRSDKF
ncbi:MAG: hypothetical protein U0X91_03075 [Spirosomataceae bacterium]